MIAPLYGTKTHPLSPHAISVLRNLMTGPCPANMINPGVINRLQRENLITLVPLPSPYRIHKNKPITHAMITEAGKYAVEGS